MTSSDSGGAFRLFERPRVIRRVGALLGRGEAHVGQCAAEVRWLNLAAHEAVYDRQVPAYRAGFCSKIHLQGAEQKVYTRPLCVSW